MICFIVNERLWGAESGFVGFFSHKSRVNSHMKDSRLIEILSAFSREELIDFGKFLLSPFVKTRRNVAPLLTALTDLHPGFDEKMTKKTKVFGKIFPGEEYNEKKMINLMSDLTKEAENFLKHQTLDKNETESLLLLSKGYYDKKLLGHSVRVLNTFDKKIQPGFSPGKDYYAKLRQSEFLKGAYYTQKSDFEGLIETKKRYFEASAVQFIFDYIQLLSSVETILTTYGKPLDNKFIESVFKLVDVDRLFAEIDKSNISHKYLIALHYYYLKTITEPEEKKFYYSLRDEFYGNISMLDREEKHIIFNQLANYCTEEVSRKNQEFYEEALDVYKKMLENNAYSFSENEYMQVITYRNIIYFCNTVKDDKWFEYFVEKYTDALSPEYRHDMKNFANGNLWFLRHEYERSLVCISEIVNEFFLFKSDLRNILLKIYYELGYFEQAYSMIDSYKHFLSHTSEISGEYKEFYKNFVKRYLQLLKMKSGRSKDLPGMVRKEIEKETKIVNKNWLLEKIIEFNQNNF